MVEQIEELEPDPQISALPVRDLRVLQNREVRIEISRSTEEVPQSWRRSGFTARRNVICRVEAQVGRTSIIRRCGNAGPHTRAAKRCGRVSDPRINVAIVVLTFKRTNKGGIRHAVRQA